VAEADVLNAVDTGQWAKRLSWAEVAQVFHTSWDTVHKSVKWLVYQGLIHRSFEKIESLGIDELLFFYGHNYMTLV
jgi:predicted transcriptional regulator